MAKQFDGKIALDIRDSTPDWDAFLDQKAPKDAPNVLVILYDDTGCAAWSTYGGRINMPTLDRLASQGLTYAQWHTTSVCSPTRSTLLTGRNHHQNGFGTIAESAAGFPGYAGHIPAENATIATVLRDAGWSTFWVGKNHNVPVDAFDVGANRKRWPLGLGYDRFYGFIGGETNQWYPTLIEDNHFIEQPYSPEDGYHFSKDIADKAIGFIRDTKQSRPDKPWYNFLGIAPEQKLSSPAAVSGKHVVGVDFAKSSISENLEVLGTMTLYIDDEAVATADFRTQSGHYALCGEGVAVGRDSADPASTEYSPGFSFTGGRISKVTYDVGDDAYVDLERRLGAILARD